MLIKSIVSLLLIILFQLPAETTTPRQGPQDVCQAENKRLTTANQKLRDQVSNLQASVSRLERDLGSATAQVEKCKAESGRSSDSNAQLESMRQTLNEAKQKLDACDQENKRLIGLNNDLKKQLDNSGPNRDAALNRQLDETKNELERCNGRYATLSSNFEELRVQKTNFDQQLRASNQAMQEYKTKNSQLSVERDSLKDQLSGQNSQLTSIQNELKASQTSVSDLTKQLLSRGEAPSNPEGLLELATASQAQTGKPNAGVVSVFEEDGKVHVIRELVIGTLQTIYEKQAKPEKAFPLKAIFKPHPIITPGTLKQPASQESISWFIDLQYPSQKSSVIYDQAQSGQKPTRRPIDPNGGEETWIWSVVPPANFDSDMSDLIVFAEYQLASQTQANRKDIVHEPIKFQQIVEPGALSRSMAWIKENLNYVLGVITVLVGIWGGVIKTKKDKLELELKRKEQPQTS